ncbi:HD-GYP domain-containing protein [Tepidibacillus fermentans]|uniref:HD-GYP domain-containing protein (C-di-GMP phosphodiesterase class II) n=1 Tax=Tepidibacillus fermentans TaxID=1281767 RepID=A0A4R3KDW9_9BACI|nr:HD-GYP domain-containing protein [Tepidibacillus fermentans]TCS80831.1 HD-GYP domain-containing protein (c-di-GMP phosphodiesterase class II) [Tepidibacillus fermentans]
MPIISIQNIQSGMVLKENVYSKLGGLLYKKGTILKEQDQEILFAFGVTDIHIIDDEKDKENNKVLKNAKKEQRIDDKSNHQVELYQKNYNRAFRLVSKILKSAQGNPQIPIIELRNTIEPLLDYLLQNQKVLLTLNFNNDLNKYEIVHALSVGMLSYMMANWIGMDQSEWMQVALAGVLHDIGMSRIPSQILNKKKSLDYYEKEEIKKHTVYGYYMLKGTKGLNQGAILAVLQHHERNDGSGYPLQLKQEQIHTYSKIIAIADVFHAMISKRSYREQFSYFKVLDQLLGDSFGKLEPKIVQIFVRMMSKITLGSRVVLNNGLEGNILFINTNNPTRPLIQVSDQIINLEKENKLFIQDILI